MTKLAILTSTAFLALGLTACTGAAFQPLPDQANLCLTELNDLEHNLSNCSKGQKIAFVPTKPLRAGQDVSFTALHCDLTHAVVSNIGGVTCVFNPVSQLAVKPAAKSINQPL